MRQIHIHVRGATWPLDYFIRSRLVALRVPHCRARARAELVAVAAALAALHARAMWQNSTPASVGRAASHGRGVVRGEPAPPRGRGTLEAGALASPMIDQDGGAMGNGAHRSGYRPTPLAIRSRAG